MAAIRSLLNPAPEFAGRSDSDHELSLPANCYSRDSSPYQQARKKQKICKDAAVFIRGPIRGECRYPPYEYQDEVLAAQHKRFDVFPMGEIADYPRHIPYNSEKKLFQEKTGRESLEVFQYRFKIPDDDVHHAMLWDYNIGLVRTTPLFKCTGHSKTTPAKMLNRNPGLRDICHSITGGALVAQGYWMPYEAAKAVAATFCWHIRYALTPVFGTDFPALCTPPESENYADMIIDAGITKRCAEEARYYRALEGRPSSQASSAMHSPLTPDTPTYPRSGKHFRRTVSTTCSDAYASEGGSEGSYTQPGTPEPMFHNMWTPTNTPRSVPMPPLSPGSVFSRQRATELPTPGFTSSSEVSPKLYSAKSVDRNCNKTERHTQPARSVPLATWRGSTDLASDEKAAHLLMSLKLQPALQSATPKSRKRRASA